MNHFDIADEMFAMDFDCAARLQWDAEWTPTPDDVDPDFEAAFDVVE